MITRINRFEAKTGSEDAVFEFLKSIIAIVQHSEGCHSVKLLRELDAPARTVIIEEWSSVNAHQAASTVIPPDRLRQAMELLAAPPAGNYYAE
jgi:quinol monooxygenase YgiN